MSSSILCHTCGGKLVPCPDDGKPSGYTAGKACEIHVRAKCEICGTLHVRTVKFNDEGKIMSDKVDQTGKAEDGERALSRAELLEKLRTLQERIQQVEADKKNAATDYADQLKDLRGELKDTLATLKNAPKA